MRNIKVPDVIFENNDFLAINKPAGMLVHGARIKNYELRTTNGLEDRKAPEEKTLVNWLLERYPEVRNIGDDPQNRPGIVHRLDKDTSGVILIPKTQEYFLYLKRLFEEHKIKKTYLAIVVGDLKEKEGIISKPIGIKDGTIKRSVHSKKQAKEAITEYKVLATFDLPRLSVIGSVSPRHLAIVSLLMVTPQTGRTHQIRLHLSSIGHPILGDTLYGNKHSMALSQKLNISRQMLHALSIEFKAAPGNKIKIEAETPPDFRNLCDKG